MLPSTLKSILLPTADTRFHPNGLDNIARFAVALEMPICVLCLTETALNHWQAVLADIPGEVAGKFLAVIDGNRITLADWQAGQQTAANHLTVLAGAYYELSECRLSVDYVRCLVETIPTGLVVLA